MAGYHSVDGSRATSRLMVRLYARAVAVASLGAALAGLLRGLGAPEVVCLAGAGAMFAYAGFFEGELATVRHLVGGLGVLMLLAGSAIVLAMLAGAGFDPLGAAYLVVGAASVLAARYPG